MLYAFGMPLISMPFNVNEIIDPFHKHTQLHYRFLSPAKMNKVLDLCKLRLGKSPVKKLKRMQKCYRMMQIFNEIFALDNLGETWCGFYWHFSFLIMKFAVFCCYCLDHRTFTCNMHAFGLSKELCDEFLRKQCVISNISKGKPTHRLRNGPIFCLTPLIDNSLSLSTHFQNKKKCWQII